MRRAGVTLVELLVVLAILSVMAGVVGLAWRPRDWTPSRDASDAAGMRRRAVQSGTTVRAEVIVAGRAVRLIAFPDGRVVGAAQFGVNPLTGKEAHADTIAP